MKNLFISKSHKQFKAVKIYNGSQLKPLFAYENFKLSEDSIISWVAPCHVQLEHMVDFEDKIENSKIAGDLMLHFIVEVFPANLYFGVSLQRILTALAKDLILKMTPLKDLQITREGDDLYVLQNKKTGKLSISIATVSAVATHIHFALNILNSGTPVATACLNDLKINSEKFATSLMKAFSKEYRSIAFATKKVKPL